MKIFHLNFIFTGSEDELKDGKKQSRKRRHKSISPIVFDKDSSGSDSESSGSEGKRQFRKLLEEHAKDSRNCYVRKYDCLQLPFLTPLL